MRAVARPRRNFLEYREVPRLLWGAGLGDAPALRRLLGARKGGRIGSVISVGLLTIAAPSFEAALVGAAAFLALGGVAAVRHREVQGLNLRQCLRLLLWTVPGPLALAGAAHLAGIESVVPLLLAAAFGYLLLDGGLRAGL